MRKFPELTAVRRFAETIYRLAEILHTANPVDADRRVKVKRELAGNISEVSWEKLFSAAR
jgi:16S rRNA C1402 (ribose-2'-O) methylase RsmI